MSEFPKWVRYPGKPDTLVDNADAEAAQMASWEAEKPARNPLLPQLDHDKDGRPGGSLKQEAADIASLRAAYKQKFGKKAFGGWDAAEITKRMAAS